VKRVERAHLNRKGFDRAGKNFRVQRDQVDTQKESTDGVAMRMPKPCDVDPVPDFVFEEVAGNEVHLAQRGRRRPAFAQKLCERDRTVEIDQGDANPPSGPCGPRPIPASAPRWK